MLGQYRKARGLKDVIPIFKPYEIDRQYLCPSSLETEFPMTMPGNITSCGPLLLPSTPVSDTDTELLSWLKRKPTVLISMGTLVIMDNSLNQEIASGLRVFLSRHPDVQILWKIQKRYSYEEVNYQNLGAPDEIIYGLLATEIASGQVRIVNWLKADPVSILESSHIVCSVHHGGSNTYHEAIRHVKSPMNKVLS
jgi:UDP:flavonoid glycosyltransferase YjiC (YdhE family)